MGMCKKCEKVFSVIDMTDGVCKYCLNPNILEEEKTQSDTLEESKRAEQDKIERFQENRYEILKSIIITSETSMNGIEHRIDFVSTQCVYGLNIIKDFFTGIRNIVGGRIKSIEEPLEEANIIVIEALKEKAYFAGGNAIIGVKIEHTYNNAGAANMVSIFGTGTIVKIKV